MNLKHALIESSEENIHVETLSSWHLAVTQLNWLVWNPEKKSEEDLIMGDMFGLHLQLSEAGGQLKASVYHIPELAKPLEFVDTVTVEDDGSIVTISAPLENYDPKYFVRDEHKVAEKIINLKPTFGPDWDSYLHIVSNRAPGGSLEAIFNYDVSRKATHTALAGKLLRKLERMGFETPFSDAENTTRNLITLLVDYHYRYGGTSSVVKQSITALKNDQPA